jgi:protein TonB
MSSISDQPALPPDALAGGTHQSLRRQWPWWKVMALVAALHASALLLLMPFSEEPQRIADLPSLLLVSVLPTPAPRPSEPAPARQEAPPTAADVAPAITEPMPVSEAPAVRQTEAAPQPAAIPEPALAEPLPAPSLPVAARPADVAPPVQATATYFSQLKGWLNRNKRYPTAAKKARQQGVVIVNFTIDRRGMLLDSHVEKSSGHALLDDAALALLQRAAPMPRIPESMGLQVLSISLPIDYSLITR